MEKSEIRKYAQGMRRLEAGIWGHRKSLFYAIHLTTKEGTDNSTERFTKDMRKLVKWIRGLKYDVEYCGAMGYTPEKGLLHFHGLLRVKGGFLKLYDGEIKKMDKWKNNEGDIHSQHIDANRRVLGDKWDKIHGAFVVKIDEPVNYNALLEYATKHIMKDYNRAGLGGEKFLMSSSWKKEGIKEVVQDVKEWYLNGSGYSWLDKSGWKACNIITKAYCEGKNIIVDAGFGYAMLKGEKLLCEIYEYNEKGERIR